MIQKINIINIIKVWTKLIRLQIGALCGTYGLIVSLFLLGRITVGEEISLVGLLNHFIPWLGLGSLICALIALVSPYRKVWVLYNIPPIIAVLILYAPQFLPNTTPNLNTDSQQTISAATYNVKLLNDDRTPENIEARWRTIETLNADIIGMQEVAGDPFENVVDLYPYNYYAGTIGLLSRFRLDTDNVEQLGIRFGEDSLAIFRVEADIEGEPIAVYVAHFVRPQLRLRPLNFNPSLREASVNDLIERLETETLPTIVLCDCNMAPDSEAHGKIGRYLADSWEEQGFGFGFTAPADPTDMPIPIMRTDYIWYSDLNLLDVEIWPDPGNSDHFPVMATLGVPEG